MMWAAAASGMPGPLSPTSTGPGRRRGRCVRSAGGADDGGALIGQSSAMHFPNKPTITTGLHGVPPGADDDASHPTRTTPAPQRAPS
jgi:hypothetical protein